LRIGPEIYFRKPQSRNKRFIQSKNDIEI
jgi:hypothetical protein